MVKLLNRALGEVRFRISGSGAEKLLSRAAQRGIALHEICRRNQEIQATVCASAYRMLFSLTRGLPVRLRVEKKMGLPFFLRRYRGRVGLPLGLLLFFALTRLLSLFVWNVEIEGETALPAERIYQAAAELGIAEGSYMPNLNLRLSGQELMNLLPELSWASVNASGCKLIVQLHDRVTAPEVIPYEEPCNIKARSDGVILRLETERGQEIAVAGQTVLKGELLVSGVWEDTAGEILLYHAQSRVYALTSRTESVSVPLTQTVRSPTGREIVRKHVLIFGAELPLSLAAAPEEGVWARAFSAERVSWNGVLLPVRLYREIWQEQTENERQLTQSEALAEAKGLMKTLLEETCRDCLIRSTTYSHTVENGTVTLRAFVQCEENIAEESPIYRKNEENIV